MGVDTMPEIPADTDWIDPEAPWWAKLRRAQQLMKEVARCCDTLDKPGVSWSLDRQPEDDQAWCYVFRQHGPIPADLAVIVGDTIHNLRSALDTAAYFLAVRHVRRTLQRDLTEDEESLTEFPIKKTGQAFDRWLKDKKRLAQREQLFGSQEAKAMRCVQPFSLSEEVGLTDGGEDDQQAEMDLLTDESYALNTVWNIDIHRRLPRLSWHREPTHWSDQNAVWNSQPYRRQDHLTDGQILGTFRRKEGPGRPEEDPVIRFVVHLADDPYHRAAGLVRSLERFHQNITGWVLPRMFAVADGHEPPMLISFGPPAPAPHESSMRHGL
jgi:hypothetical protein